MDSVSQMLVILLIVVIFILFALVCVWIFLVIRTKKNKEKELKGLYSEDKDQKFTSKVSLNYTIQSIFSFMEFDRIEDNMIVEDKGNKYLMVVKCQGVNYDLMSEVEKTSVEQGFLEFLNTLTYQIQICIQTATVDLEGSLVTYRDKVKKIGSDLTKKELEYNQHLKDANYDEKLLQKERMEVAKARNLYEYSVDIISNTERMSLNKNILSKEYYIIIPYYADEVGVGDYSKDEIQNMAFSELYTRCQSAISSLAVCGIVGKILDSVELSELLYQSYNRDEADIYDMDKAMAARYDEMYTTAPDILDRKMRALDDEIEKAAIKKANEAILEVKQESQKEREYKKKQVDIDEAINNLARLILDKEKSNVGIATAEKAKKKLSKTKEVKKEKGANDENAVKEEKQRRSVGRPRKVS